MKRYVVLLVFLTLTLGIKAQEPHFITQFGLNLAALNDYDNWGGQDYRAGVNVGVGMELPVSNSFSIVPGVFYSMQGSDGSDDWDNSNFNSTCKIDYINVPVLAKYYFYKGLFGIAGPQFGFKVKARDNDTDISSQVKSFDFSLSSGIGYQFPSGLFFTAVANTGLTKVFKTFYVQGYDDYDGDSYSRYNTVLQLNIGYEF